MPSALVTGWAMRWLNVDDLKAVDPDPRLFPRFSEALRQDFSTEIRLFLADVLLEQQERARTAVGRTTAILNERLAKPLRHQGVLGPQFRRVELTDPARRGLLGKSARAAAHFLWRPHLAGAAWRLGAGKADGHAVDAAAAGRRVTNLNPKEGAQPTTLRARLEIHRQTKSCNQCHGVIDPLGLPLENFDVIGAWRTQGHRPAGECEHGAARWQRHVTASSQMNDYAAVAARPVRADASRASC